MGGIRLISEGKKVDLIDSIIFIGFILVFIAAAVFAGWLLVKEYFNRG